MSVYSVTSQYQNTPQQNKKEKIRAAAGAVIGTAIPMIVKMKKNKITNPLKLSYEIKDMLVLSATSVAGGVGLGIIGTEKSSRKKKYREGIFQFLYGAIPTLFVGGAMALQEKSKYMKSTLFKFVGVLGGITAGMFAATKLANFISDPTNKEPDRKIKLKDCLVSADDLLGALVIAKFPFIDKLHAERLLPLIYSYCGYRAGSSSK